MSLKDWQEIALVYKKQGYSGREIARVLGRSKTSVNDFFKSIEEEAIVQQTENKGPRVLFLDIETRPLVLQGWALFNQNFGLEQIQEDWTILSYSAKYLNDDEVFYSDVSDRTEDDLLSELYELFDKSDFLIGHNLDRFDLPKIRARMITRGFPPHSPVRTIDTLKIAKQEFKFTSNKLAYLTNLLCKANKKLDHSKFAGHKLWKEFVKGNPEAIQEMREYNMADVTSLEELYFLLAPWSTKSPQFEVYEDSVDMSAWQCVGFVHTNLAKYEKFKNKKTGQFKRGRINLLSKEERADLLANIT